MEGKTNQASVYTQSQRKKEAVRNSDGVFTLHLRSISFRDILVTLKFCTTVPGFGKSN